MALTTVPASLSATALTLTTAAQPNITSVGTLTGLTVSGNIAGTLTTAAQTNITSLGTLSSLNVGAITSTGKLSLNDSTYGGWIQSNTSVRIDIDNDNNQTDRAFIVSKNNAATNLFIIKEDGNVGIGTSNPLQKIHSSNGFFTDSYIASFGSVPYSSARPGVALDYASDGARLISWGTASARGTYSFIQLENDGQNQQTALTIDTGGNVGIGTPSPSQLLHVDGHAAITSAYSLMFGDGGERISGNNSSEILNFFTGATERMRLSSSGQLFVGDGSPQWPTGTLGNSAGRHMFHHNGAPMLVLWDESTGAQGNAAYFLLGGKPVGSSNYFSGARITGRVENGSNAAGEMILETTNTSGGVATALTLNSSQNATFAGTISSGAITSSGIVKGTNFEFSGTSGKIHFGGSGDTGDYVQIQDVSSGSNIFEVVQDTALKFGVDGVTGNATFAGNVGVGTTNPAAQLHIDPGTDFSQPSLIINSPSNYSEGDLYVLHGRNVNSGIGYSSTAFGVNVNGALASDNIPHLRSNTGGLNSAGVMYVGADEVGQGVFGVMGVQGTPGTDLNHLFTVLSDGNVGIGTTSPEGRLMVEVTGANATPPIKINRGLDGGRIQLQYGGNETGYGEIGQMYAGTGRTQIWIGANLNSFSTGHNSSPAQHDVNYASWFGDWDSYRDRFTIGRIASGTTSSLMVINSSGNVGITATPGANNSKFAVGGAISQDISAYWSYGNLLRRLNISGPSGSGTFTRTVNIDTQMGFVAQGGAFMYMIHGWQSDGAHGMVHWHNNGSGSAVITGVHHHVYTAQNIGVSVSKGTGDLEIDFDITSAHVNTHGWYFVLWW